MARAVASGSEMPRRGRAVDRCAHRVPHGSLFDGNGIRSVQKNCRQSFVAFSADGRCGQIEQEFPPGRCIVMQHLADAAALLDRQLGLLNFQAQALVGEGCHAHQGCGGRISRGERFGIQLHECLVEFRFPLGRPDQIRKAPLDAAPGMVVAQRFQRGAIGFVSIGFVSTGGRLRQQDCHHQ
jgi:hypothetical protein